MSKAVLLALREQSTVNDLVYSLIQHNLVSALISVTVLTALYSLD